MDYAIRTFGLTKTYKGRPVVDDVSLSVEKGAIYGFIGNNGAGKSTLIRMLTGLAVPTAGSIELFGDATLSGLNAAREHIGSIVEVPSVYANMTAEDNLKMRALFLGKNVDCKQMLRQVGLPDVGKKLVKNFSLGMKQRLGIAMAIMGEPQMLILDEPINGLDPAGIYEVRELLREYNLKYGTTIFISSHILGELAKIATCYGIIENGKLVKELSSEELKTMGKPFAQLVVDDAKKACDVLLGHLGIEDVDVLPNSTLRVYQRTDELPTIVQTLNKNDVLVLSSQLCTCDLEEYFVGIMGGRVNG